MNRALGQKETRYGILLALAAMALIGWIITRFTGKPKASADARDKRATILRQEIENLQILLEQAKLDLRRVRHDQNNTRKLTNGLESDLTGALQTNTYGRPGSAS